MENKSVMNIIVMGIDPRNPGKTPAEDIEKLKVANLVGYYDPDESLTPDTEMGKAVRAFACGGTQETYAVLYIPNDGDGRTLSDAHNMRLSMESFLDKCEKAQDIVFVVPCGNFCYPGDPSEKALLSLKAQLSHESVIRDTKISWDVSPMWLSGDPLELIRHGKEFAFVLSQLPDGWHVCDTDSTPPRGVMLVHELDPYLKKSLTGRAVPIEATGITEQGLYVFVPDSMFEADDLIDAVRFQAELNNYKPDEMT